MTHDADVIVAGSGPSGVSVIRPLLEAGMRVLLLDGGRERRELPSEGSYHDLRRGDPDQWRVFLGERLEALRPAGPPSPKFDAPGSRFAFEPSSRPSGVEGRGFAAVVSLARGGFSNIWGAGVASYGDAELDEFPFGPDALADSYERVARRIGVTGFEADDLDDGGVDGRLPSLEPLQQAENARRLMRRYARRREALHAAGVRMGRPRIAVLTRPLGRRGACTLCDMCIWGCRQGAIYSATHDLEELAAHAGLDYRPGTLVESLASVDSGYRVDVRAGAGSPCDALTAPLLVLAAGGLATTRLVLEFQGRFGEDVRVIGVPGMGFAVCLPERIGAAVSTREFSMSQLSFSVAGDPMRPADAAYGTLFPASGVPAAMILERMPLTRPAAVRLLRRLQPALLLGNCFVPGRYSRNTARLERDGEGRARLVVRGGVSDELVPRLDDVRRRLSRALLRLGAVALPNSFSPIGPGEDIRYAGMLPMRASPREGETDAHGELHGAPGLYVADLAAFPAMPAKHHTLTLMANAERVGAAVAARWSQRR